MKKDYIDGQKVYVFMGRGDSDRREGIIVEKVKHQRYKVRVLVDKPTAKTSTTVLMRFNDERILPRVGGTKMKTFKNK